MPGNHTRFTQKTEDYLFASLQRASRRTRGKVTIWLEITGEKIPVASFRMVDEEGHISTYAFFGDSQGAHASHHARTGKTHIKDGTKPDSETLANFEGSTPIETLPEILAKLWPDPSTYLWMVIPPSKEEVTTITRDGFVINGEAIFSSGVEARPMKRKNLTRSLTRRPRPGALIFDPKATRVVFVLESRGELVGMCLNRDWPEWQATATHNHLLSPCLAAVAEICRRRHQSLIGIRTRKITPELLDRINRNFAKLAESWRLENADLIAALTPPDDEMREERPR